MLLWLVALASAQDCTDTTCVVVEDLQIAMAVPPRRFRRLPHRRPPGR